LSEGNASAEKKKKMGDGEKKGGKIGTSKKRAKSKEERKVKSPSKAISVVRCRGGEVPTVAGATK